MSQATNIPASEIQKLLKQTINQLNHQEKRDNRPRFSVSFIRKHPWLFAVMYAGLIATLVVMLASVTLADLAWLLIALFTLLNGFFFFDVNPQYRYEDIDVLDLRVCYNGEWYNTRTVPQELVERILSAPDVPAGQKNALRKMASTKSALSFYDIFLLDKHPVTC